MNQYVMGLLLVGIAVLLEALGQLCFKMSAARNQHGAHPLGVLRSALTHHWVITGVACFLTEAALWTLALKALPLSVAFPAGSICFVFVALLSLLLLREKVGRLRWLGISLILAGVLLVTIPA